MSAVGFEDGSELKTGQIILSPGAVDDSGDHDFVALIELGKAAIEVEVGRILRAVVGVVVGRGVEGLAVGVIAEQSKAIAETLFYFHDSAFVNRVGTGGVLVVLDDQRIYEALDGGGTGKDSAGKLGATQGIVGCACVPVAIGNGLAVGQLYGAERRGQKVGVDGDRQSLGVGVDAAERDGEAGSDLTLNAKGSLLRNRRTIAGLIHEKDLKWRERAAVGYVDADRLGTGKGAGHGSRRDACVVAGGRSGALN